MQKRRVSQKRTLYQADDLSGALPLGTLGLRALVHSKRLLAFSSGLVADRFGSKVSSAMLTEAGYLFGGGDVSTNQTPAGRLGLTE